MTSSRFDAGAYAATGLDFMASSLDGATQASTNEGEVEPMRSMPQSKWRAKIGVDRFASPHPST